MICLSSASYRNMSLDYPLFCLVPGPDRDVFQIIITALIRICSPSSAASFLIDFQSRCFSSISIPHKQELDRSAPTLLIGPCLSGNNISLAHFVCYGLTYSKHLSETEASSLSCSSVLTPMKSHTITENGNSSILLLSKGLEHGVRFKA